MNLVDFIIVSLLVVLISLVVYFSFVKHRGNPCSNCIYYKSCNKRKYFIKNKDK